jgi:hypothetical protein
MWVLVCMLAAALALEHGPSNTDLTDRRREVPWRMPIAL